jgi:predicted acyltransferase
MNHIVLNIVKRGLILFFIGLFITAYVINFDFPHLRIPGVLQRIAVVFVICSTLFLKLSGKAITYLSFGLLILYYILMNFVSVPGIGSANLNPETNLGAWLDRLVFSPDHLYRFTKTWDPEGILSTIPSIATGLFGVLTGIELKRNTTSIIKLKKLFGYGSLFAIAGILANVIFPINKNLWTSSYVLFTAGLSMLLVGICYWLIDVKGYKSWIKPFIVFGTNSIFVYLCSELFPTILRKISVAGNKSLLDFIYGNFFSPLFSSPYNASLAFAISLALFFMPFLWFMYNRNIIVKV